MAAFNVSLDDSSPLITYSPLGAWFDTPSNDTQASSYNSQSLHTTSSQGASAIFVFNGTGVWLFGGLRSNYGPYSFSVDGKVITTGTSKNDVFQANQLLGGKSDLEMGEHTAVLRCESGAPIDLDNIIFQTQVSHASGPVNANTVQDNASNITYSPSDAWTESKGDIFSGGTVRHTDKEAATASMKFTGDAVAVYGGSSFDHGEYIVDIDGRRRALNGGGDGQSRVYHPQVRTSSMCSLSCLVF
ncbi:hypothetical protein K474DRAFT_1516490 [Panus rudis PR-1116 ss-1]|nr:hypothetical protein K474DRAFT_1516490 [Panus rudis PR-1116 ss-1]